MSDKRVSEDLFEGTKMSFGDHIEELRVCLVRSLIGIGVAFVLGLFLSPFVVQVLSDPLERAISKFKLKQAKEKVKLEQEYLPAESEVLITNNMLPTTLRIESKKLASALSYTLPDEIKEKQRTEGTFESRWLNRKKLPELATDLAKPDSWFLPAEIKHLSSLITDEQRAKLMEIGAKSEASVEDQKAAGEILDSLLDSEEWINHTSFSASVLDVSATSEVPDFDDDTTSAREFKNAVLCHVLSSYFDMNAMGMVELVVWEEINVKAQSLGAQEPFMIWLKAGLITGIAIASPWVFYQIWIFVAAGLFPHEKKYVYIYLPFSLFLFIGGALFAFYAVFRFVLDFLFTFNSTMGIDPDPRIGEYLGFVMFLPIGFGIAFQLPLVMLFLNRIGVVPISAYMSKWRIAILVICVVSMVFTPTDPISMIMMAIPLTFLYFGGIGLCKWMPKGRNPFAEAYEP